MPKVFFLTDPERQNDVLHVLRTLPTGWGVIFRHYDVPHRQRLARSVAQICRRRGLVLLIAGDHRLAADVGADGLHLPEGLARNGCLAGRLTWIETHGKILTVSAHSPAALNRAESLGAHAALLSPVFPTQSHTGAKTLGPLRLAQWSLKTDLPIFALGGMRPTTLRRIKDTSVQGIALSGGVSLFLKTGLRLWWSAQTRETQ